MGSDVKSHINLDDRGIIRVVIVGDVSDTQSRDLTAKVRRLVAEQRERKQKAYILVDLAQAGASGSGARLDGRSFLGGLGYDKIAFFGLSEENAQTLHYLINTVGRFVHVRSFRTEARALQWLRFEQSPTERKSRRVLALALIFAASLVVWQAWLSPLVTRIPDDFSYEASVVSYDNFYNEQKASYSGKTLSDTKFTYKTLGVKGDVLNIENMFDVRTSSGEKVFAVKRLYGIDRRTGKHVAGYGDHDRHGYLFAPQNLAKQDFVYWHVNYDTPATMKFQDEETIAGVTTYHYKADFHADQTKNLTNLPGVGVSRGINLDIDLQLWVEPSTGYLVKYQDGATAYYYDLATGKRQNPWNQFSNNYTFDSINDHAQLALRAKQKKDFYTIFLPTVLAIGSGVFLLRWLYLLWRSRRKKVAPDVLAKVSAFAVSGAALAVLVGWAVNSTLLTRLHPSFSAMHPLTAFNFLIQGLALWLIVHTRGSARIKVWVYGIFAIEIFVQVVYFANMLWGVHIPLQDLLAQLQLPDITNISPVTSLCFLLVSLVIPFTLWLKGKVVSFVAQITLLIVLALAAFAICGYTFNLEALYSIGWFRSMALHTAFLLIILVCAYFSLHPEWFIVRRARLARKNLVLALWVLLATLATTALFWQQTIITTTRTAELGFQSESGKLETEIENELTGYVRALEGARGLFAASNEVSRDEWRAYVDNLHLAQNYPGMLGVGFGQSVPAAQKAAHISAVRKDGFPAYDVFPGGSRDTYVPVVYIEPLSGGNQRVLGYDMYTENVRRAALQGARDTGETTSSGGVTLLQDAGAGSNTGILLYAPVYKTGLPITTVEQRRAALQGYVYAPIRMQDFMKATIGNQTQGLNVGVFDSSNPKNLTRANRLYVYDEHYALENGSYVPKFSQAVTATIANRDFVFRFSSLPSYNTGLTQALPGVILFSGLVLSVVLTVLAFFLSTSRNRALRLASIMTEDLRMERNTAIINERKLQAILASIGDGVFVIDAKEKIMLFNKSAEVISGVAADEAIGQPYKHVLRFFNEQDGSTVHSFIDAALKGKRTEMARYTSLRRKDGTSLPVADSAAPVVSTDGDIIGVVVVFRDITRERELEKMKDEFLSIASHELRTPMGAMRANVSMILDGDYGKVNKGIVEPLTDIHASTVRLVDLVNDLLNAARVDAGRMRFSLTEFDAAKVLEKSISDLKPLAKERGLKLVVAAGKPAMIQSDTNKLTQIVTNLVGNALKFTDKGTITLNYHTVGDKLEVTLADTGIGIAADEQKKLFGRFSQISSQEAGKPAGTGLGLYISRQIIRKLGGELWLASSQPGEGSVFAFTLPLAGTTGASKVKKAIEREARYHPDQK